MTITRTLTVLSITAAALLTSFEAAQADHLQDAFRTIRKVQVSLGGVQNRSRRFGPGHSPTFGQQAPGHHTQICPPPPVQCVYCVYYIDCHGHWILYGSFASRWSATSAEHRLRHHGYRTLVKVKHQDLGIHGYPSTPGHFGP